MRAFGLSPLVVLALATGANAQEIGRFAFEAKTLGGQTITEKDFEANVLIVDLWGTWCPPCVQAVPFLEDLYRKYKQYGLEIVGFSYEGENAADPARVVRKFAAKHEMTYQLAIGTPAIKRQIPKMRGFPTFVFFEKGLVHHHTQAGFIPALHKKKMENWVRKALGMAPLDGTEEERPAEEKPEAAPKEEIAPEEDAGEPEPLPPGVIFKPADGDTGFDFAIADVDGVDIVFKELRGKPVVLALTSTWDGEALSTARLLNELHDAHDGKTATILAASLEQPANRAAKVRAIKAFRSEHELRYRVFPAGLGFQKKIHLFSGMPLFLVFDKDGRLVLREIGASEKTSTAVKAAIGG